MESNNKELTENPREELIKPGAIAVHFKRNYLSEEEKINSNKYVYKILAVAEHTDTWVRLVIYKAMYPDENGNFKTFARPLLDFLEDVKDKDNIIRHRFTICG